MEVTSKMIKTASVQSEKLNSPVAIGELSDEIVSNAFNNTLANDTYHKSKHTPEDPNTYSRSIVIESYKSEAELLVKMEQTIDKGDMTMKLYEMRPALNDFVTQLKHSQPNLAQKEWGFSVDENDKLVALGDLTDKEKEFLEQELNNNRDIKRLAKEIPDIFIRGQEYDRGYDGKGRYWGKYDVTRENFKEIIDIKQLFDSSYGPYGDTGEDRFDPFTYADNLRAQLANKAEVKYGY